MDARIVADLRARRTDALGELLERYGREVHAVSFLIVRDRAAAEDITIETLLSAWDHTASLRAPSALRPWLLRIATNRSLSHRGRARRVVPLELVPDGGVRTDRDRAGPADLDRIALREALDHLPVRMRAAIVLHYLADLNR